MSEELRHWAERIAAVMTSAEVAGFKVEVKSCCCGEALTVSKDGEELTIL